MPKISSKSKKIYIIILLSLSLIVCIITANYFSLLIVKTDIQADKVSSSPFEITFISLSKSQVKNEALSLASDIQKKDGSGFVIQNENYFHLTHSAYINKNDAQLVQNSLKNNENLETELVSIKFASFSVIGSFSPDEIKVLTKSLNAFLDFYKEIYDISVSVDTNVYNEISARLAVNNTHNNLAKTIDNFTLLFGQSTSPYLQTLSTGLSDLKSISQSLCGGVPLNSTQTYSSLLKYRYTEALQLYLDMGK